MNDNIDIVLPWVDGSDPVWIEEKEACRKKLGKNVDGKSTSNIRYQNWDNLKYWFRAVERFMPWVHKIFLITWGHVPDFLNINHPKIRIVRHEEYIPHKYLPTFNSNTIEMNVHRIADLAENYILFNDDTFPLQPIEEQYYFKDNIVCDEAIEGHITPIQVGPIANMARYVQVNNMIVINRHFKKREVQQKYWEKWYFEGYGELLERTKSLSYWYDFAGFRDPHMANALKKSTLAKLWSVEPEVMDAASKNQFRAYNDVSQYLIRYWQLCKGDFCPRRTLGKMCLVDINNYRDIAQGIRSQEWQMVSLNEDCVGSDFEKVKSEINNQLNNLLSSKSLFEKSNKEKGE